jgi:type 1 glutamine amidotransferase
VTHTLIVSGGGDYTDPWHPFEATSAQLREILSGMGHDVSVETQVGDTLASLAAGDLPDLLVVNAGNAELPLPSDAAALAGIEAYLAAGRPMLVLHVAATLYAETDDWERIVGGRWVRGTTMHPDWGLGRVHVATDTHPIVAGLADFDIEDERYSYLRVDPAIVALATQEHDGIEHPILWAKHYGDARIVYDALGHEQHSYEAEGHRAIIRNAADWLLPAR